MQQPPLRGLDIGNPRVKELPKLEGETYHCANLSYCRLRGKSSSSEIMKKACHTLNTGEDKFICLYGTLNTCEDKSICSLLSSSVRVQWHYFYQNSFPVSNRHISFTSHRSHIQAPLVRIGHTSSTFVHQATKSTLILNRLLSLNKPHLWNKRDASTLQRQKDNSKVSSSYHAPMFEKFLKEVYEIQKLLECSADKLA